MTSTKFKRLIFHCLLKSECSQTSKASESALKEINSRISLQISEKYFEILRTCLARLIEILRCHRSKFVYVGNWRSWMIVDLRNLIFKEVFMLTTYACWSNNAFNYERNTTGVKCKTDHLNRISRDQLPCLNACVF
jgi:hypothetical protein